MPGSRSERFKKIRYVFLDRDGVLNRKAAEGEYVFRRSDFELLPGVEEALARLKSTGRKLIMVTNQRCVALGLCSEDDVRTLHQQLQEHLGARGAALDAIYFCPHNEGECQCRKPRTGMLEQAFRDFPQANGENSIMIGDSLHDIEAGSKMGMATALIAGESVRRRAGAREATAQATVSAISLQEFVKTYFAVEEN